MRFNSILVFLTLAFGVQAQNADMIQAQELIKKTMDNFKDIYDRQRPQANYGTKFVFISTAMPRQSLIQLLNQSYQTQTPLYLRGFIEKNGKPDLIETQIFIGNLIKDAGLEDKSVGISVDSPLFQRFHINQVPAFVLTKTPLEVCFDDNCSLPDYNIVYGNISIGSAFSILNTGF